MTFDTIMKDLKAGKYAPVYFLCGEEDYFIDLVSDYIEEHLLDAGQKDFNCSVFYGKDCDPVQVVNDAKQYPVFSDRRLVVVKEAQEIKKWDAFEAYLQHPSPSTVLVISHKHKKVDKRTGFGKLVEKKTLYFESDRIKEEKLPDWITDYLQQRQIKISPDNARFLVENLGNDLSRIVNEMNKLAINLQPGEGITAELIERYIGISKEYNIFEFTKAISAGDFTRAIKILGYFEKNPKAAAAVVITSMLYNLFSKLYILHYSKGSSDSEMAKLIGVPPFFFAEYKTAARKYPLPKVEQCIHWLSILDGKIKGVNNNSINDYDLLKEFVFKAMR